MIMMCSVNRTLPFGFSLSRSLCLCLHACFLCAVEIHVICSILTNFLQYSFRIQQVHTLYLLCEIWLNKLYCSFILLVLRFTTCDSKWKHKAKFVASLTLRSFSSRLWTKNHFIEHIGERERERRVGGRWRGI